MRVIIEKDYEKLSKWAADHVVETINRFQPTAERPFVLGLPTGSSPQGMYANLVKAVKEGKVSFKHVITFNMDEYVGIDPQAPQGFGAFLKRSLYDRVPLKQVHLFDCQAADPEQECLRYGALLEAAKPELCIYGVGENGHLAFNDPPVADFDDPKIVKLVELDPVCRQQQVNDGCFASLDEVPRQAFTLTIPVLMRVSQLYGMVPGKTKIAAIDKAINGPVTTACPASILRTHPHAVLYLDEVSAQKIKPETY